MTITRDAINQYFSDMISLPSGNILSNDGFVALADWSERQVWWNDFVKLHHIGTDWRTSTMGDPYVFSVALFRFLHQRGHATLTLPSGKCCTSFLHGTF
jgi:hypothetical protein